MMDAVMNTSQNAYEDIKPKAPNIRSRVLELITNQNGRGISRTEIARALKLNEITVGSRITELLQAGKVRRKGETVLSTSGKPEHLYVLGNGIPLPSKEKAVEGISRARLIEVLKAIRKNDVNNIGQAFIFADQPEGRDFWIAIHEEVIGKEVKALGE
jgi:predicted ArsR family transcriptional regulator